MFLVTEALLEPNPSTLQHCKKNPMEPLTVLFFMKSNSLKGQSPFQNSDTHGYSLKLICKCVFKKNDNSSFSLFLWRLVTLTLLEQVTWHKISPFKKTYFQYLLVAILEWQQQDLVS